MNALVPVTGVSPLRQRLIDEMEMRRFGRETQRNYIRDVARFATFLGRPPDTATAEEVRCFQVEQLDQGVSVPTMNAIVSALRFFFTQTLDRPDLARKLVRTGHIRKLPVVLSQDEVARLLGATTCLKHQAALSVAYGAGLRAAEVTALKVRDIDSERMLLRVERGKSGQYRNAMLPAGLLALLREWWKAGRQEGVMHPEGWLFPGQHYLKPLSTRQLHRVVVEAGQAAGIDKRITAAATGTVRGARARLRAPGWPSARLICCRSATSMSSLHCPPRSLTSRCRTRRQSTACCSRPRRRRC